MLQYGPTKYTYIGNHIFECYHTSTVCISPFLWVRRFSSSYRGKTFIPKHCIYFSTKHQLPTSDKVINFIYSIFVSEGFWILAPVEVKSEAIIPSQRHKRSADSFTFHHGTMYLEAASGGSSRVHRQRGEPSIVQHQHQ